MPFPPLDVLVAVIAADPGRFLAGLILWASMVAAVGCISLPTRCRSAVRSEVRIVCIDGQHRRLENPGLEEMLEIIDETKEMMRSGRELRGC